MYKNHKTSKSRYLGDTKVRIKSSEVLFQSNQIENSNVNILVLTNSKNSELTKELRNIFESLRLRYKIRFIDKLKGTFFMRQDENFNIIIFESIEVYSNLANKRDIHKIGQIFFTQDSIISNQIIEIDQRQISIHPIEINELSKCFFSGKNEESFFKFTKLNKENLNLIKPSKTIFSLTEPESIDPVIICDQIFTPVLKTKPQIPERKVFFGVDLKQFPIIQSIFIDALIYVAYGHLKLNLTRYVQVDIDDIFVGATGFRMKPSDVFSLAEFQQEVSRKYFKNSQPFKFNLGFSGFYYQSGNHEENLADELLISKYTTIIDSEA